MTFESVEVDDDGPIPGVLMAIPAADSVLGTKTQQFPVMRSGWVGIGTTIQVNRCRDRDQFRIHGLV